MKEEVTNLIKFFTEPEQKKYSEDIYRKTAEYQKKYGFERGTGEHDMWNNESDAFKHAFMQADLARRYGNFYATAAGNFHELDGRFNNGQSAGEENMDKWNNQQGREIAAEIKREYGNSPLFQKGHDKNWDDMIAKKVNERMRDGRLITNPNDSRKYQATGFAAPISNHSDNSDNGRWITKNGKHIFIEDD